VRLELLDDESIVTPASRGAAKLVDGGAEADRRCTWLVSPPRDDEAALS
jgi:hypothetical protein